MRILLITNYFPPANTVASHRLYSFVKYLPDFGIDIDVCTPRRTGTLEYNLNSIIQIFLYPDDSQLNKFSADLSFLRRFLRFTGLVPLYRYLRNQLFLKGKAYFNSERMSNYQAIFVSFGPESVLRLGYYLSRKYNLPLIVDYRDLWLNILIPNPSLFNRFIISFIEKRIIQHAALITTVSQNLAAELHSRYQCESVIIYNGYFDDIHVKGDFELSAVEKSDIIIGYSGSLYNGIRPIEVIFPALKNLSKLKLHVAIFDDIDYNYVINLCKKFSVNHKVVIYQNLTNEQSILFQRLCDILLLLNRMDGSWKGALTGKLFEYISARKFILGIGHPSDEAAEIIQRLKIGVYVNSTEQASKFFETIDHFNLVTPEDTSFFTRRNQTKILAEAIYRVFPQR
ncbi:MAG: glycosyltransferase [Candidatus Zhuqueibacterota bacterium]